MGQSIKIITNNLEKAIKNKRNALLIGSHGTGKTTIVSELFDKHFGKKNKDWFYFSASTLDPFLDFVGCPSMGELENGEKTIDMIRPKIFCGDGPKAIFMDEFNRAPKAVINAIMELTQFQSINGKEIKNLCTLWGAINPEDEGYSVERMDPAHKDRFHLHINFPNTPDSTYFTKKYGANVAKGALSWWKGLDKELKGLVSPRRLDYALQLYQEGMDLEYCLPARSNYNKLQEHISSTPILEELENLSTATEKKKFFRDENKFVAAREICCGKDIILDYIPYWPKEKIVSFLTNESGFKHTLIMAYLRADQENNHKKEVKIISDIFQDICDANQNQELITFLKEFINKS